MQRRNKPEVLAPAGNLRGLKTAVDYGADAVYCGGKAFGMRSAPKNLSLEDFEEGARYAHERGARVYVTFNVLPRNNEVEAMREYLGKLEGHRRGRADRLRYWRDDDGPSGGSESGTARLHPGRRD